MFFYGDLQISRSGAYVSFSLFYKQFNLSETCEWSIKNASRQNKTEKEHNFFELIDRLVLAGMGKSWKNDWNTNLNPLGKKWFKYKSESFDEKIIWIRIRTLQDERGFILESFSNPFLNLYKFSGMGIVKEEIISNSKFCTPYNHYDVITGNSDMTEIFGILKLYSIGIKGYLELESFIFL